MRAVWSFWSAPYSARTGRSWRDAIHHLLAWGLSVRLARRHYLETMLVTDEAGKALLVDNLGLSFTHVSTELERLRHADLGWWALGKLIAYSLQDRPFVHLDTDVFLWKALPSNVAIAPVFAQHPERYHAIDQECGPVVIEDAFRRHRLGLPREWEWARSRWGRCFHEVNCGIAGGTRADFFRYYAKLALDLVLRREHAEAWNELLNKDGLNQIVEQFILAACVEYHRFNPVSPYRGIYVRYLFPSLDEALDGENAARTGFTHLLGDAKKNAFVVDRLERRVREEDPAFYEHCRQLSRHHNTLAPAQVRHGIAKRYD